MAPLSAAVAQGAGGTPSKKSTTPVSSEYSAPTTSRPSFCDQLLEHLGAVAQMARPTRGRWRARPGRTSASRSSRSSVASSASTDGRTRSTIERRLRDCSSRRPPQLLERGEDRAALRVAEHDDQPRAEALGGELDAADLRRRDDVAGDADDEQVAQALVEDDLGRHARVGAAEDDRERLLPGGEPRRAWLATRPAAHVRDEAAVALAQSLERVAGGDQRHGGLPWTPCLTPPVPCT